MSRSWAGGSSRAWRKLRASILLANANENAGRCTLQIKGVCTGMAQQVHHIKGKQYGDDQRFLTAVCKACNQRAGAPGRISPPPRPRSSW